MLIQEIDGSLEARMMALIRRTFEARSGLIHRMFENGVQVWRGQIEGAGEVRSVLPTTTYGSREAASLYAMQANDRSLARPGDQPFVMPAVLRPRRVFAAAMPDDADPFVDLDVILACLGRSAAERLARELSGHIQDTNAFEELSAETGMDDPAEMVGLWPGTVQRLPCVLMHEALRLEWFADTLREAGYDAVLIGGSGETALELEWHVLDPAIASHGFAALRNFRRGPGLDVRVSVFEDVHADLGTARADASEELVDWFRMVVRDFSQVPLPQPQPTMPEGDLSEVEVFLCSRETAADVFDLDERALGAHIITTPESDPFCDEAAFARRYRILIVIDRDEIERRRDELIEDLGSHVEEAEAAEATTLFHELAHVALFASNANRNSPADVDVLSDAGEIENDMFDMSTGYGIRPLLKGGEEHWSESANEARQDMEEWCEARGREWCRILARGGTGFYAALGLSEAPEPGW